MEKEKLLEARLADMARAAGSGKTRFSPFLSETEQAEAEGFFARAGAVCRFYGGNPDATRKMACVSPYEPSEDDYPVSVLSVKGCGLEKLSHRDYLGALMSLGLERDAVGDIVPDPSSGTAYIFLTDTAAELVLAELSSVGGVSVTLRRERPERVLLPAPEFEDISFSASSKRADAVLASLLKLSRDRAAELIDSGALIADGKPVLKREKELAEGAVFTVKGAGKFKVDYAEPRGKKDRISYLIKKYK